MPYPVYEIKDLNKEPILGTFYEQELSKVSKNRPVEEFIIEKIVKSKKIKGKKHCFVKWRGYPDSFNSWIPESDINII